MWFSIPFGLATALGLAAVALDLPMTVQNANDGLVPPSVAYFLLGKAGAIVMTIMLFMAVTGLLMGIQNMKRLHISPQGTGSAEMVAVASLGVYDIYRTYINPKASGRQIVLVSRGIIIVFGLLMGGLAIGLFALGLSLGFVYLFMGILVSPAVIPVASCLTWGKASSVAAIGGSVSGVVLGITAWLVTCQAYYGMVRATTHHSCCSTHICTDYC